MRRGPCSSDRRRRPAACAASIATRRSSDAMVGSTLARARLTTNAPSRSMNGGHGGSAPPRTAAPRRARAAAAARGADPARNAPRHARGARERRGRGPAHLRDRLRARGARRAHGRADRGRARRGPAGARELDQRGGPRTARGADPARRALRPAPDGARGRDERPAAAQGRALRHVLPHRAPDGPPEPGGRGRAGEPVLRPGLGRDRAGAGRLGRLRPGPRRDPTAARARPRRGRRLPGIPAARRGRGRLLPGARARDRVRRGARGRRARRAAGDPAADPAGTPERAHAAPRGVAAPGGDRGPPARRRDVRRRGDRRVPARQLRPRRAGARGDRVAAGEPHQRDGGAPLGPEPAPQLGDESAHGHRDAVHPADVHRVDLRHELRGDAGARLALGLPRRARPHGADGRGHAPLLPPAGLVVMHIVVMGAGGVGGYFGAKLVRAGERVTMVARGAQLEALRRDGLRVRSSVEGEWLTRPAAVASLAGQPLADAVLFCVKAFDTEAAAGALRPVVGPETAVLSLQNGVDNEDKIDAVLGAGHALGGAAYVFATLEAPGVIAHRFGGRIVLGELDGRVSPRAERLRDTLAHAGIPAELSTAIRRVLWEKYLFICAQAGTTAVTRARMGVVRDTPETWRLYRLLLDELAALARAAGVALAPDAVETIVKTAAGVAPEATSSLHHDLLAGRRLQLEALHGHAVRLGARLGVALPTVFAVYAAL